ncbi:MAG: ABC transporter ATP-binding protein [Verrucomicrobiota bacterium]|nr:ABC transporter ATP-binding protein [Verrucomicrobiota bacterium]
MSLLRITNLKKSYAAGSEARQVIDIPEFNLGSEEQVALAGSSGSGKTTLLNLIAGIILPDSGTIEINGREISSLSELARDRFRAENMGYVFQTFNLLQGYSALENVLLGMRFAGKTDRGRALELLARVGLKERLHDLPRQLSVGQQQRVAIARAVANRPKLVLADEPTGNLDAGTGGRALELIRSICAEERAGLLLVSHDPAVLGRFSRQVALGTLNRASGQVAAA